jgi:peptidoglycan/xylan/chitin deacetylase (PgdA/CDA1 family)
MPPSSMPAHRVKHGQPKQRYLTLPQYLLHSGPTLVEGFDTFSEWTALPSRGVIFEDTTNVTQGTGGVRVEADATSTQPRGQKTGLSINYGGVPLDEMRIDVWNGAGSAAKPVHLFLSTTTGITRYWLVTFGSTVRVGWNRLTARLSDFASNGGMTWSDTITTITCQVGAVSGEGVTFDNLVTCVSAGPACAIMFDDAYADVIANALPRFRERGLRASFGVNSDRVGTGAFASQAQLLSARQDQGWSLANHSTDHSNLVTVSGSGQAAVEAKITPCTSYLTGIGVPSGEADIFVYPGGTYNDTVQAAVVAAGQIWARSTEGGTKFDPLPWVDDQTVGSYDLDTNTMNGVISRVNGGIFRKELIQLYTHASNASGSSGWPISRMVALINHLIARRVPLLTYAEVNALRSGAVTVPVPW